MKIFCDRLNEASQTTTYDATTGGLLDKTILWPRTLDRISLNHEDLEDNGYGSRFGR